jgi:hypothetical protein
MAFVLIVPDSYILNYMMTKNKNCDPFHSASNPLQPVVRACLFE